MTYLYLVPNTYLRQLRRTLSQEDPTCLVMTMPGLVAQVLKEGLVSYKEDAIMEEIALWQAVQEQERLEFFTPIAQFTGFIKELKWLFQRLDHREEILSAVPEPGQKELELIHGRFQEILAEQGVLTKAGQIAQATQIAKKQLVLAEVTAIRLQGIGALSPLEDEFIRSFAQGRKLEIVWPQVEEAKIEVQAAEDPMREVELIGEQLRQEIKAGVPLSKLGVAFPNPSQYLPIVIPLFEKMQIPWHRPTTSLRNTPLGKTILTLLAGALEGWHKHHLELLTAPGWGYPFNLNAEEHRLLRLAPPLKGLPAWRNYLGEQPGWERVCQLINDTEGELISRPVREYGIWLETILHQLQPEAWVSPEQGLENWAELVKAWDGLQNICQALSRFTWEIEPGQFIRLLENLLDHYQIQGRRVFAERVQIMDVQRLGAYTYHKLFVGGLVEGQFPPHKQAHWLTKTAQVTPRDELYNRLISLADHLVLSYPEVDRSGELNLPATILPEANKGERDTADLVHAPSLFLGKGILHDDQLLQSVQERVLENGLSVSQLNRYANCPYQFFCDYVLNLAPFEEESLELDARDHGNIIHNILHRFWQEHLDGPLPSIEEAQAEIEGLLTAAYLKAGQPPSSHLIRNMRRFIRKDLEWTAKGFRPQHLEKWFQGVVIPTFNGPVEIRGRIDRIDVHPDGAYVLYDYKTGTAPTLTAMVEGKDVQIAAYLLASQSLFPQGRNVGVAYYVIGDCSRKGIFNEQYRLELGVPNGKNVLPPEDFHEQHTKFTEILRELVENILRGHFPIEPASTRICTFCPFQGICRKEVGLS